MTSGEAQATVESALSEENALSLDSLLDKVCREAGYDFRCYRRGTVTRRLARRLYASGSNTYAEYTQFLDHHPEEYQRLADDLTIKVSGFFRSQYAYQQLAGMVLPALLGHKVARGERRLSFWSAACARGEEPYSMAVLLAEFLGGRPDFEVSIYATDISEKALKDARAGVYSPKDVAGVTPTRMRDYFTAHGQGYQVKGDIRQMVEFSVFDLSSATQPPFANLDCVFCRNVLIYFQKPLQERVLNMLYESLAVPGYLVLGEVETPTNNLHHKLKCLDSKARIYKKV